MKDVVDEELLKENGLKAELHNKTVMVSKEFTTKGECQICLDNKEIGYAIVPCGHGGICHDCLLDMKLRK